MSATPVRPFMRFLIIALYSRAFHCGPWLVARVEVFLPQASFDHSARLTHPLGPAKTLPLPIFQSSPQGESPEEHVSSAHSQVFSHHSLHQEKPPSIAKARYPMHRKASYVH